MDSINQPELSKDIAHVLGSVHQKGVRLWSSNGKLHFQGPKGALTQREIETLRRAKSQILAALERLTPAAPVGPAPASVVRPQQFPLSFAQLAHWNLHQLAERHSHRTVASATRIQGRLNVEMFTSVVREIVRRHDALRTQVAVIDGSPVQQVTPEGHCALRVDDCTSMQESNRQAEIQRVFAQLILEPIDVSVDRLCSLTLLRLRDDEHVLLIAMEHMISDAVSMGILQRELFMAYTQRMRGDAISLPEMPVQITDYAVLQRNGLDAWKEKHGSYWSQHLNECQRLRFPSDHDADDTARAGWGTVHVRIDKELKSKLRAWCRTWRTTLVLSVFTAYVALVLRWCNTSDAVIQYQTDGRADRRVENSIGYFASMLFLRLQIHEADSFLDLLSRVTAEYCNAYEHADHSYLEAQTPRPRFARNPAFNWVPQRSTASLADLDGTEHAISCSRMPFIHPIRKILERDTEPLTVLHETDDEVVGSVTFPLNRFSVHTMERFGRNFQIMIEALLSHPQMRVKDVLLY